MLTKEQVKTMKAGDRFKVHSGLGGSFTIVMDGRNPNGIVLTRHEEDNKGWPFRQIVLSDEQARLHLFGPHDNIYFTKGVTVENWASFNGTPLEQKKTTPPKLTPKLTPEQENQTLEAGRDEDNMVQKEKRGE